MCTNIDKVTINTTSTNDEYKISVNEDNRIIVNVTINKLTGEIKDIIFGKSSIEGNEHCTVCQIQKTVNKFGYKCAHKQNENSSNNRNMSMLTVSTIMSVLDSISQGQSIDSIINVDNGAIKEEYLEQINKTNLRFLHPLELGNSNFNRKILKKFEIIIENNKNISSKDVSKEDTNNPKILLVPYPIKGNRKHGHMTLAVVDLKATEFKIFDSSPYNNMDKIGELDNQFKPARKDIKVNGFNNGNNCELLNQQSQTYTPPQTLEGKGDCTYWVEAAILVLNEIISNNPEINLDKLSEQLIDEKIQRQIQEKHDKVLKTNGSVVSQINNDQQIQQTGSDSFGSLYSTNKEVKTHLQKVEDDSTEPKTIAKQFSSLSSMDIINQNEQTTTKQPPNTPQNTPQNIQIPL